MERSYEAAAQQMIDRKTKPPGSLGRLEDVARQLCTIQRTLSPSVARKSMVVFAADHGVAAEGVSAFPPSVTAQMVLNFLAGGAAINAFCRTGAIDLAIVDVGVDSEFGEAPGLISRKIRRGTRNFMVEAAMTREEAEQALEVGSRVVNDLLTTSAPQVIGLGEMGIANTTSAAAVIAAITGVPPESVVGRGTGVDDAGLAHKTDVVRAALARHKPDPNDAIDVLQKVGGFEIGAIAGATLAAAAAGSAVMIDGLISTAGALLAWRLSPRVTSALFCGHRSAEQGHKHALDALGVVPLLDLGLRLGEGTGAALAMHLLDAACAFVRDMASFESAGVSDASPSIDSKGGSLPLHQHS